MAPLSDYNTSGYKPKLVAAEQGQIFSDLDLTLVIHPNKNDIIPLTDIDAIRQSIKNIILTNYTEKLFKPTFGSNVAGRLFENADQFLAIALEDDIRHAIRMHEPRGKVLDVIVIDNSDRNAYDVSITFGVDNSPDPIVIDFALNRLR